MLLIDQLKLLLIILLLITAGIGLSVTSGQMGVGAVEFLRQTPQEGTVLKKVAYVSGEVQEPGVYEIGDDTRISDIVSMAGGFTKDVDTVFVVKELNLAAFVKDEQHIFIPKAGRVAQAVATPEGGQVAGMVSLNSASMDELISLPGIGVATAEKIIDARPFSKIEELLDIQGIGDKKYSDIKNLVTL